MKSQITEIHVFWQWILNILGAIVAAAADVLAVVMTLNVNILHSHRWNHARVQRKRFEVELGV